MEESGTLQFRVSVPGKVILHGEHSVVYGKPAIAAVIGCRNYLLFTENVTPPDEIKFSFQALNLLVNLDINDFNELFLTVKKNMAECEFQDHEKMLTFIKKFINDRLLIIEQNDESKFKTLLSVFYLMCGILLTKKSGKLRRGFTLDMTAEIKIGAGLGSSASFAVCLSTAFLILASRRDLTPDTLSPESKDFISKWAFNSEKIMHTKPSGVDNTVCTFGGIVKFTKGLPMEQISICHNFNILLIDTKVSRSTANLVAKVAELKKLFPKLFECILTSMEACVDEAAILYKSDSEKEEAFSEKLSNLFEINSGLLRAIGVSHCKLEEIFTIAQKYKFASKLTGAGGGGYAIILLPQNYKASDEFKNLCCDLDKANFEWSETIVGGSGVAVEFLN